MDQEPPIINISRDLNVRVSFTSELAKNEENKSIIIFRLNVFCGNEHFEHEYPVPIEPNFITFEGHRRFYILKNIEKKIVDAIWELIPEASKIFFENTVGKSGLSFLNGDSEQSSYKKQEVTLNDKINYRHFYRQFYEQEKGWKNAYKFFKSKKKLNSEKRLEETKKAFPNLPEHLIDKFSGLRGSSQTPSKLAKLHVAEFLGLPAQSDEYRRKLMEGKQIIEPLEFYYNTLSQTVPEDLAGTIFKIIEFVKKHKLNKGEKISKKNRDKNNL